MERNKDLLQATMSAVIAADKVGRWDQYSWFRPSLSYREDGEATEVAGSKCGAAMCFYGWGAQLSPNVVWDEENGTLKNAITNEYLDIRNWGDQEFGLTCEEGELLSSVHNTLSNLKDMVDILVTGGSIVDFDWD